MNARAQYQVRCPVCLASPNRPCSGKAGERLRGVHFQRATALHRAQIEALKVLYAPLPIRSSPQARP